MLPWAALLQVQPLVLLAAQWVLWWVAWQVPLLADWREPVMACVRSRGGLLSTSRVGAVQATRIELPDDFSGWVSAGVRNGTLAVPAFSSSALASTFTSPSLKELS